MTAGGAYDAVLELLRERSGLVFPPNRRAVVRTAIDRAMRAAGTAEPEAYLSLLRRDREVMAALLAEVTVGETYFFREPEQLDWVRAHVLPEIAARRGPGYVARAWSAGCATGEEAYTLAILAHEAGMEGRLEVLGTDVSLPRLEVARAGRYAHWSMRGVPERVVHGWFRRVQGGWEVIPPLRRNVSFRPLNLADEGWPSAASGVWSMDLVLCRNVLIYLAEEAVEGAARRLFESLAEGGWVVPGASDPPLSDFVDCEVVMTGSGLVYRRKPGPVLPAPRMQAPPLPAPAPRLPAALSLPRDAPRTEPGVGAPGAGPSLDEAERAYAARDYGRAAELAGALLSADGDGVRAWTLRVRALANAGRVAEAAAASAAATERHRTDAELAYLHALLLLEVGRPVDALSAVRRALYLEPGLAVAHLLRGTAAARLGKNDDARRDLRNAERALAALAPGDEVPAAGGETAGRMLASVRSMLAMIPGGGG